MIAINFMSSENNDKECVMDSKSDNVEIMINDRPYQVIEELFEPLLSRYHFGLETLLKDSDFISDCVHLLYYKCHKINLKRGRPYIRQKSNHKSDQ